MLARVCQPSVEHVHDRGEPQGLQEAADRACELELDQERNASAVVTRYQRGIAEHQPPTLTTPLLRDSGKETLGFLVREGQQGQFLMAIKRGDDPRRPPTETSGAGVEQPAPDARGQRRALPRQTFAPGRCTFSATSRPNHLRRSWR